jgi:hypothetical protein
MPYLYMLQPVEYLNTNCYKIGLSSTCDLSRLKSYGHGTEYIQYFQCSKYREAEKELINNLNNEKTINLFKGREYFCGNKKTILNIFVQIMLKYTDLKEDEEEMEDGNDTIMEEDDYEYMEIEEADKDYRTVENVEIKKVKEVIKENKQKINYEVKNNNTTSAVQNDKMLICVLCNFKYKYQSDFNRHLNSKKHKQKISNKVCSGCFKKLSNTFSKNRHEQKCEKLIQLVQ